MCAQTNPVPRGPGLNGRAGNLSFHDLEPKQDDFGAAVRDGLGRHPKTLPCKFFYDQRGSRLFDRICELAEYYPTRTEIGLLRRHKDEFAALAGEACHLIEFGSGSSHKVRILLEALDRPAAYTAIDISRDHLLDAADSVARDFPEIEVIAVCADYTVPFDDPRPRGRRTGARVGFFPGSTIGNFAPAEAERFLRGTAGLIGTGGGLLIGVDLKKDPAVLHAAYNDREGVTADFNLNLLRRINRELDGGFDLDAFSHEAIYNAKEGRIEMHLISRRDQTVSIGDARFTFAEGETIHTENSYKFTVAGFQETARRAGFSPAKVWTDPDDLFSIHYLTVD